MDKSIHVSKETTLEKLVPIRLLDVNVHPVTTHYLYSFIANSIATGQHNLVAHVNVHGLNLATEYPWLKDFLNSASLVFCDGYGVKFSARLLGHQIPERITYADWIWTLGDQANQHHWSIYFLGGRPDVAAKSAEIFRQKYPNVTINAHHGYFDKSAGGLENLEIISQINKHKPNILLVGFGMPMQEKWLQENWHEIDANIALTGGAVFDYLTGHVRRGPKWMTDNGLEWLARLAIEPGRLWRRYIIGNPLYLFRVLTYYADKRKDKL